MVFANDIRQAILRIAEERGKHSFSTHDVARELDAQNWMRLEGQVRFVADVLVKEGKLTVLHIETVDAPQSSATLFCKR